ncbi:MAG: SprB repeat-containing protein, partial [Flavobacteriales bacterium]
PVVDNTMIADVTTTATICPAACNGAATVAVSGGAAPYSYVWSDALAGMGATSATNICEGTYSILVEDDLGCTAVDTFTVVDGAALVVQAGTDTVSCGGPISLQAVVVGATTNLTWVWTPATGLSDSGSSSPTATVSATTNYVVTVYPAGFSGCAVTDSVTIIYDPGPDPGTDSLIVICPTQPPFALIDMLGGTPTPGGSWANANGITVPGSFNPATGADGAFSYSVTSAVGCTNTANVIIEVLAITDPVCCGTVDAGPDATICGLSHVLHATTGNIGSGTWSGPLGYTIMQAQSAQTTVVTAAGGTATFIWTEDDGTCHVVDSVTITFTDTLVAVVSSTDALCNGACNGTVTAVAQGGTAPFNFQWSNASGIVAIVAVAEDLCAGSLSLLVSDANGCTAQVSQIVSEPAPLQIQELSFTEPWCYGSCDGSVTINDPSAVAYSFNGGSVFGPSPVFPNACAGAYQVMIRNANGCQAVGSIVVTGPPQVIADFIYGPDPTTVEATTINFINTSVNAVSGLWDIAGLATSGENEVTYTFDFHQPGEYNVCLTVVDNHGCPDSMCRTVV